MNYTLKTSPLLVLLVLTFVLQACSTATESTISSLNKSLLYGTWILSHEETTGDTSVYRPATYPFPSARGRTGFTLKENGEAVEISIAPADGPAYYAGTWRLVGERTVQLSIAASSTYGFNRPAQNIQFEVLSLTKEILYAKHL